MDAITSLISLLFFKIENSIAKSKAGAPLKILVDGFETHPKVTT